MAAALALVAAHGSRVGLWYAILAAVFNGTFG